MMHQRIQITIQALEHLVDVEPVHHLHLVRIDIVLHCPGQTAESIQANGLRHSLAPQIHSQRQISTGTRDPQVVPYHG